MTTSIHTVRLDAARWADVPAEVIAELLAVQHGDVEVDAEGVSSLPAIAAQVLLAAHRQILANGAACRLVSVSDRLRSNFTLLGMDHLIQGPTA
jgi:anti-anti-sigma regulatory factor